MKGAGAGKYFRWDKRESATGLTHECLLEILDYNPETGLMKWRKWRRGVKPHLRTGVYYESHQMGRVYIHGHYLSAHRVAWFYMTGAWPKGEIDHINGDKSDNRFVNLRDVSRQVNQQNQRKAAGKNAGDRLLGASGSDEKGWRALIKHSRKQIYLGTFPTMQEAHEAYLKAKRRIHAGCTI